MRINSQASLRRMRTVKNKCGRVKERESNKQNTHSCWARKKKDGWAREKGRREKWWKEEGMNTWMNIPLLQFNLSLTSPTNSPSTLMLLCYAWYSRQTHTQVSWLTKKNTTGNLPIMPSKSATKGERRCGEFRENIQRDSGRRVWEK